MTPEVALLKKHGIDAIKDEKIRITVGKLLKFVVPEEFFSAPASSTGKYHPKWSNTERGLVKHTLSMLVPGMRQAEGFFYNSFTPITADQARAAIVLHDTFKGGKPWARYTVKNHGELAAKAWLQVAEVEEVDRESIVEVYEAIYWHNGKFTPNYDGRTLTPLAQFVHTIDMGASSMDLEEIFQWRDLEISTK